MVVAAHTYRNVYQLAADAPKVIMHILDGQFDSTACSKWYILRTSLVQSIATIRNRHRRRRPLLQQEQTPLSTAFVVLGEVRYSQQSALKNRAVR